MTDAPATTAPRPAEPAPTPALAGDPPPAGRAERLWVWGILLAALVLNVLTASRSPTVWKDELMFVDPAVLWLKGEGWISRVWPQADTVAWASNAPLHSFLLVPWLKTFGINPTAARSLNFLLITATAALLWHACRRGRWIDSPAWRVALVALVICGSGVSFSYRSGRYDALGMLILSAIAAAATIRTPRRRALTVAALAALIPWAGFQLVPYAAVLGAVLLACFGRSTLRVSLPVLAGGIVGGAALMAYFHAIGGLQTLQESLAAHRQSGDVTEGRGGLAGLALRAWLNLRDTYPRADPSLALMAAALAWALLARRDWARRGGARAAAMGVCMVVAVPAALGLAFIFAVYYTWMAFIPLAIVTLAVLDRGENRPRLGRLAPAGAVLLVGAAAAVGLPARLAVTAAEWRSRDHQRVTAWLTPHLRPDDIAVVDAPAYYLAVTTARRARFLPTGGKPSDTEKHAVTVIVCPPEVADEWTRAIGGTWTTVATLPPAGPEPLPLPRRPRLAYSLTVLRRTHPTTLP